MLRRLKVSGLHDGFDLLVRAVELYALFVRLGVEPVVEHAAAAPNRRLAALERRPREAAGGARLTPPMCD
jgi:hypothetical protein